MEMKFKIPAFVKATGFRTIAKLVLFAILVAATIILSILLVRYRDLTGCTEHYCEVIEMVGISCTPVFIVLILLLAMALKRGRSGNAPEAAGDPEQGLDTGVQQLPSGSVEQGSRRLRLNDWISIQNRRPHTCQSILERPPPIYESSQPGRHLGVRPGVFARADTLRASGGPWSSRQASPWSDIEEATELQRSQDAQVNRARPYKLSNSTLKSSPPPSYSSLFYRT